jgi:hypothetical protein
LVLALVSGIRSARKRATPPPWTRKDPYLRRTLALAKQGANLGIAVLPFGFKNPATIRSLMETQFREILDHLYPNSRLPEKSSRRRDGSCALPGFPAILGRVRIRPCRSMAVVHPVFQNPRAGGGRLRDRQAQAKRPSAEARLAGAGG